MTPSLRAVTAVVGTTLAAAFTLTACGSDSGGPGGSNGDQPNIVASTNVWASVAEAVAGPDVTVTSIIDEPSADPHSYEASPTDAAELTDASLVVYNGGGYDQFVDDVVGGESSGDQLTVNAFDLFEGGAHAGESHEHGSEAGHEGHDHGSVNEHVWYDLPTVEQVARAIADKLAQLDPDNAEKYSANADEFSSQLASVTAITDAIAAAHAGTPVAQTEPTAHYLLEAAQLTDATPAEFTEAVENETDPSPASIAKTRELLQNKQVQALVYNVQTEDRVTQDMRKTAEGASVPVVEVTETLPEDEDYIQWQTGIAQSLSDALG
nr:zinc ABC transporter substrate-binding protein [Rhodococcus sp. HNM0569]